MQRDGSGHPPRRQEVDERTDDVQKRRGCRCAPPPSRDEGFRYAIAEVQTGDAGGRRDGDAPAERDREFGG